jgi:hypothetical protein
MRPGRGEVLIVLAVAGVAVILSQVLFVPAPPSTQPSSRNGASPTVPTASIPTPSVPTPTAPTPTAQSVRYTNAAAGYSFLRPAGWEVSDSGTVSELTGPDQDVTVSFGVGADGGLRESSAHFAASIEHSYADAQLDAPSRESIAGRRAVLIGGSAVNDEGTGLRFLAITLRVDDENYAIAVFVSDTSDPVRVLPAVEEIVASFEAA